MLISTKETMLTSGPKTVLVVEGCPKTRKLTSKAVAATGARCIAAKDAEEGAKALRSEPVDLLVVDWDGAQAMQPVIRGDAQLAIVLLTNRPVFKRHGSDIMISPMSSLVVSNFVAFPEGNDPVSTRELVTTVAKLFTNDIFGLEKYLGWGAALHEQEIHDSDQRNDVVQSVCADAASAGMSGRAMSGLALLVDELLMNGIWDAPVDESGKAKYADRSRTEAIRLLPNETVTMRYASDGNVFGLSVSDNFGRLDHDLAVKYIHKCFDREDQQVSYNTGGSGLGLYMAYNSVSSFVINVDPGVRTEVIGLIRLARMPKPASESAAASRSLCYFRTRTPQKGE